MKSVYAPYLRYGTSDHYSERLINNSIIYKNEAFLRYKSNLWIMGVDKLLQKEKYK